jgi:hypothetical protein
MNRKNGKNKRLERWREDDKETNRRREEIE